VKYFFVSIAVVVFVGCGQKSASETPPLPVPSVTGIGISSNSNETLADVDRTATLERLTQALRRYSAEKQRVPKSLEELVSAGYLSELPAAPAGKKYVFDQQLLVTIK
jgi:hypothetical protein